jgi:DNA-binding transcriptional MocR family regulator
MGRDFGTAGRGLLDGDRVRSRILAALADPDAPAPRSVDLAIDLGISEVTVVRIRADLVRQGLLPRRPPGPRPGTPRRHPEADPDDPEPEWPPAPSPEEIRVAAERIRAGWTPWQVYVRSSRHAEGLPVRFDRPVRVRRRGRARA